MYVCETPCRADDLVFMRQFLGIASSTTSAARTEETDIYELIHVRTFSMLLEWAKEASEKAIWCS